MLKRLVSNFIRIPSFVFAMGVVLPASRSLLYDSSPMHQCISGDICPSQRVSPQYLHLYVAGLPQTVHRVRAMY